MKNGMTYPAALQKAMEKFYTEDVIETLATPNNALAIEYIKALDEIGSSVKPVTVKRCIAPHDREIDESSDILSASQLRKKLADKKDISQFAPSCDFSNIASLSNIEVAILSKLRAMSKTEIEKTPNVLMGLENRIYRAAAVAASLNELYFLVKTKRYTLARIRRIILRAYLGITSRPEEPPYIRILGFNEKGRLLLSKMKKEASKPIITKLSDCDASALPFFEQECKFTDLYNLGYKKPLPCSTEQRTKIIML